MRFRQEPIAMVADIESMYHQVRIPEDDTDLQRFLWWPAGDLSQDIAEYRMVVHIFGATSSPSCANYALQRTAEENSSGSSPEAVNSILKNFYVDDCLKSVASTPQADQLYKDLTALCASGGFRLTKWTSNNRALLNSIPEQERPKDIRDLDLTHDALPMERTLGILWCTESDSFKFRINVKDKPITRRGILSVTSSIYDPLGFLAPAILPAKLILQKLCKEELAWDDGIPEQPGKIWNNWLQELCQLSAMTIPRCVRPVEFGPVATAQLHHLSDGSESGYGTVSYLRPDEIKNDKDDDEVRHTATVHLTNAAEDVHAVDKLINHYSSWYRLKRAVAWVLKLKDLLLQCCKKKKEQTNVKLNKQSDKSMKTSTSFTCEDLMQAETEIIKFSQNQRFKEEISMLAKGNNVKKTSHLRKLDPVLSDGVLRVGGRLSAAAMPELMKHPVIIPKDLHVTTLILRDIHEKIGHCVRLYMLSQLRQKYWIPSANSIVRKFLSRCVICRKVKGKAMEQKMADLPKDRLTPDNPPFTNVGVDYFGPLNVKQRRNTVKRYGVLFTCLTTRAVHIEIAV
ncbi:hypothetical protein N1851_005349 [Merluccius polli]|uniref:Integrase zinc-binding domain-containing protein n=1 Tax=Merluccius polli TaxID=89951 RepID=A0AA47N5Z2_MERPO|nr:hypothetical protein N1851_005349 [Merluccius polli]